MGRSRGGLTTKIHVLVDANGLPIAIKLTEGQAHDGRSGADMLEGVLAGQVLLADRAYDSDALRDMMTARGAWANIKPLANRTDSVPSCIATETSSSASSTSSSISAQLPPDTRSAPQTISRSSS